MNDANKNNDAEPGERLSDLNTMLMGVENTLLHRALDRSRGEVEHSYEFISQAAEAGVIDVSCGDAGSAPSDTVPPISSQADPVLPEIPSNGG